MRKPRLRSLKVAVDTRENKPYLFPHHLDYLLPDGSTHRFSVETVPLKMEAGDYSLCQPTGKSGIERKGSLSELATNLFTRDRGRMLNALDRFADTYDRAYLTVDRPLSDFKDNTPGFLGGTRQLLNGEQVLDILMQELRARDIRLLFVGPCSATGPRRQVGANLLRLLVTDHLFDNQYLP